jgi:hypothetical protein
VVIAHNAACIALRLLDEMPRAREHIDRRVLLIQRLGARRFEAFRLRDEAALLGAQGRRREAVERLGQAVAISRETGIGFMGPWVLGQLAATTGDPGVRRQALEEGERILRAGAVSHSHIWFYQLAMEAALGAGAWAEVDRYAAALEDYTRAEPLPLSDFFISCGRALAACRRGRRAAALTAVLERLRHDADRFGLRIALPALETALTRAAAGPQP